MVLNIGAQRLGQPRRHRIKALAHEGQEFIGLWQGAGGRAQPGAAFIEIAGNTARLPGIEGRQFSQKINPHRNGPLSRS